MLYHAMNAATMPKAPPALVRGISGMPVPLLCARMYEMPNRRKVIHTVRRRRLNARVDFRVRSQN